MSRSLAVAIAVLAAMLSGAGAEAAGRTACDASFHAGVIALVCPRFGSGAPGSECCRVVLQTAARGIPCLCMSAATARMLESGIGAEKIITWHRICRGEATVGGKAAASSVC